MNRLTDAFIIVRSLWLVLLFLFLSLFAFLLADQSVDVLWSVVEDATVTGKKNFTSSAFMLLALLFWSVSTKFTVRLIIYMSDNSSIGLSPDRVAWRKRFQNWIIKASGYIPVLVVWMGFGMAVVYNFEYMDDRKWIYIAVLFVFFVLILFRGSLLYDFFRSLRWFRAWIAPVKEKDIYHKLQGIFEPIRINLPYSEGLQPSDFILEAQNKDQSFLPQHLVFVGSIQREGGIAVGMVRLKAAYFKTLFSRFWSLFILSVGVLALAVWIDQPQFFHRLGSLGIICAALGTWQVFYLGLHILDDFKPIWGFGYYRLVLFIYFVACSYFNEDHPVFIYSGDHKQQDRPYLDQHFAQWFDALEKRVHATGDTTGKVPVIFIAAEGGALRTGAFTAATLAYLQEQNPFFREHLYTLSGVSGGSLGLSVFYAMNYRSEVPSKELPASTKVFFEGDFLSVTIAKLAFAEILGYFLPVYWPKTDRAIALERAWEDQYKLACDTRLNALKQPFQTLWSSSQQGPALFINTTNAETGQQAYFSNVRVFKVDKYDSTVFGDQDIQRHWFRQINMSSAINFSTRFP
ncbi:MAG TPA: hypothetical protein VFV37_08465, partial [Luteibaculaceae bacterium]|nr:hypothetical protein [Luteibaculaceae bacterium]